MPCLGMLHPFEDLYIIELLHYLACGIGFVVFHTVTVGRFDRQADEMPCPLIGWAVILLAGLGIWWL